MSQTTFPGHWKCFQWCLRRYSLEKPWKIRVFSCTLITVGLPIVNACTVVALHQRSGTTFWDVDAPENCCSMPCNKRNHFWFRPTHPAWSIFKQSSEIPGSMSSQLKPGSFVCSTPYYMLRWEHLLNGLLICHYQILKRSGCAIVLLLHRMLILCQAHKITR